MDALSHIVAFTKPLWRCQGWDGTIPAKNGKMLLVMFEQAFEHLCGQFDLKGASLSTVATAVKTRMVASPLRMEGVRHV